MKSDRPSVRLSVRPFFRSLVRPFGFFSKVCHLNCIFIWRHLSRTVTQFLFLFLNHALWGEHSLNRLNETVQMRCHTIRFG